MAQKRKTTLREIAELSGCSQSSVSMILNRRPDVSFSAETIERVRAAAERLGYEKKVGQFNKNRPLGSKTIAVLCPNITNPYYSTLVQSIEQAAHPAGYRILTMSTYRSAEIEADIIGALGSADIAGLIYTMAPQCLELIDATIPVVAVCDKSAVLGIDTVEMDNYSAGSLIARHLIGLGHKRVVYVSTTLNENNGIRMRRLKGIEDTYAAECPEGAVTVRSMDIDPSVELNDLHLEYDVGFKLCTKCLTELQATAFIAVNDMVAYGAIDAILKADLSVPGDYSVCGFDNVFPSRLAPVSLTTVDHYIAEKGRNAFDMLLARISLSSGRENTPNKITRIEYPPRLVVRSSTGPVKSSKPLQPRPC